MASNNPSVLSKLSEELLDWFPVLAERLVLCWAKRARGSAYSQEDVDAVLADIRKIPSRLGKICHALWFRYRKGVPHIGDDRKKN